VRVEFGGSSLRAPPPPLADRRGIQTLGRRFGFVAVLLAALSSVSSSARAEVREFYPSAAPMDVQFVYSPDEQTPDSWLAVVLKKTGMDIWVLLMRDVFLMDTLDDSRPAGHGAHAGLTLIGGGDVSKSIRDGCDSLAPSEQLSCELKHDLGDAGWNDSASSTFTLDETSPGSDAFFHSAGGGRFFGGLMFPFVVNPFGPNEGFAGGVSFGFGFDQSMGEDLVNPADLIAPFGQPAAIIPEPPIPVMLLIGAGALSLAGAAKAFRARTVAGS